jgi:hypothetical protein
MNEDFRREVFCFFHWRHMLMLHGAAEEMPPSRLCKMRGAIIEICGFPGLNPPRRRDLRHPVCYSDLGIVDSHPSRKYKGAARVEHPVWLFLSPSAGREAHATADREVGATAGPATR